MKKVTVILVAPLVLTAALALAAEEWQGFGADNQHSGVSEVDFASEDLKRIWEFVPSQHIWSYEKTSYEKGTSVWSSSLAALDVDGKKIIFAGFYDHNLYAINAQDGEILWRYTTGGTLAAAPTAKIINATPMVFIGSGDRIVYALDAKTGKKIWSYETEKWDYTTAEGIPSAGIIEKINGKELLFISFWNNNYRLFGNLQKGEIFAFNAADGNLLWRKKLTRVPLNSPALTLIDKRPVIFVTAHNGCLFCLDAKSGQTLWSFISDSAVRSSPTIIKVREKEYVVFGTRLGNIYALATEKPQIFWKFKTGHAVDATSAFALVNGRPLLFVGSHDRNLYCLDAATGKKVWAFSTDNFIIASCAIGSIKGKKVVFASSLDDNLYCLDAQSGNFIWKYKTGKLIWKYATRGDTIWSSPALIYAHSRPQLIFASYNGTLYAFGDVSL
jgi:outer membrane protein assembly factor BamB